MASTCLITVRSDDIDSNGHVGNSKYLDYADHARWDAFERAGGSFSELAKAGLGPIILETTVKFRRELRLGEVVRVDTRFEYPGGKIMKVHQTITRTSDEVLAAELDVVTGMLDLTQRALVADPAATWRAFVTDPTVLDLDSDLGPGLDPA